MARGYKRTSGEIPGMMRNLLEGATVRVDRPAIEAGLVILEAGGDFADGVIAFEGGRLGGTVFVSFDRKALKPIAASGGHTHLLGATTD